MASPEVADAGAALVAAVRAAEDRVREEEEFVLQHFQSAAGQRAVDRLGRLREAISALRVTVDSRGRAWLENTLPLAYAEGGFLASDQFTWTQPHLDAIKQLALETHNELLQASQDVGRTSQAFASRVRRAADRLASATLAQTTPTELGKEMARELEAGGMHGVVYSDGSIHEVADYTDMLARTKTALAGNQAAMREYRQMKMKYLEVFDGPSCGWTTHQDPDLANGTVRTVDACDAFPISHPRCQRSFGARPDVQNPEQAAKAVSLQTDQQRQDAAEAEAERLAATQSRAAARAAVRSRESVQARHARAAQIRAEAAG
jgi:hypothetical protein